MEKTENRKSIKAHSELIIWIILALAFSIPIIGFLIMTEGRIYPIEYFIDQGTSITFAALLILLPILTKLIFGSYPIQLVLLRVAESKSPQHVVVGSASQATIEPHPGNVTFPPMTTEQYLASLAVNSEELSQKIFKRSGAYLLVGCLIALLGVLFFYTQSLPLFAERPTPTATTTTAQNSESASKTEQRDISSRLFELAPRFGILFFIELIAFFFLKQYRITMDEFRYYESIKRQRESNLAIFRLAELKKDNYKQLEALIKMLSFFQSPDKLSKEETTELLESRKLSSDEINLFQKIIEAIGAQKK